MALNPGTISYRNFVDAITVADVGISDLSEFGRDLTHSPGQPWKATSLSKCRRIFSVCAVQSAAGCGDGHGRDAY